MNAVASPPGRAILPCNNVLCSEAVGLPPLPGVWVVATFVVRSFASPKPGLLAPGLEGVLQPAIGARMGKCCGARLPVSIRDGIGKMDGLSASRFLAGTLSAQSKCHLFGNGRGVIHARNQSSRYCEVDGTLETSPPDKQTCRHPMGAYR